MEQVGGSVALRSDSGTEWTHGTEWTLKFPVPAIPSGQDADGRLPTVPKV